MRFHRMQNYKKIFSPVKYGILDLRADLQVRKVFQDLPQRRLRWKLKLSFEKNWRSTKFLEEEKEEENFQKRLHRERR